ncbi:diacylglycerol kinase family protein [Algihabitans albus]|uniref:diacylglycerol kinase family protein n=1 Tax=Algihabitans albus TaxID=2164067 RepID=UPI0013C2C6FC|nr:diacylglycerol kinase family protein [Algihabitans albus]
MTGLPIGLVSNTLSLSNRAGIPDPPPSGPSSAAIIHRPIEGLSGLAEALDDFADAGAGVIAINGGDGTVSAVLTELMSGTRFRSPPLLALLRGGTLNMCADDVGLAGPRDRALARLLRCAEAGRLTERLADRHVIRVRREGDLPPVYGMFLAFGSLYRAIRYSYDEVPGRHSHPRLHTLRTLGALIVRHLANGGASDRILRGECVGLGVDGAEAEEMTLLLALATTLDRLVLGFRPYWGGDGGGLRFTALGHPPDRLIRRAFRVLYGGPARRLPVESYRSYNAERVRIGPGLPFALDGELYETAPESWLELSAVGPVSFVRC